MGKVFFGAAFDHIDKEYSSRIGGTQACKNRPARVEGVGADEDLSGKRGR